MSQPPRDAKRYRVYCPACNRHAVIAMRYWLTGKDVPPEELRCPVCDTKFEVLGRDDQ
jgi:uncharacterized Zn finger protein (UPF0148 family)